MYWGREGVYSNADIYTYIKILYIFFILTYVQSVCLCTKMVQIKWVDEKIKISRDIIDEWSELKHIG